MVADSALGVPGARGVGSSVKPGIIQAEESGLQTRGKSLGQHD
jgi:hypothetical protein